MFSSTFIGLVESDQEMEELCAEEGLALQGFRAQEHLTGRYAGDTVACSTKRMAETL